MRACVRACERTKMNAEEAARCLGAIREHRPDMKQFLEPELEVDYDAVLGEGGFCTAYRARFRGENVCARVVDSSKESLVVAEVATVSDLPDVAVKVHGCATTTRPDGKKYLAVLSELCENGCLEDFMVREKKAGRELSERVKLDIFLQVADGLEQLKRARVVWRDLKAKNLLVRNVVRNTFGTVTKLTIGFTDWGTAVRLPKVGKRRMTLQGPGTCGYIAPETRGPHYDFQADMWAFLVWAASMCLSVEILVDCQLEEALGQLKLEKKIAATAGQETRVKEILAQFDANVVPGCAVVYEFLKSATWVDANQRWSSDEAIEEMVDFRQANDLHLPMGGCTPSRPMSYPEESVQCTEMDEDEDDAGEVEQRSPVAAYALTPGPFAMTPYAPTPYAPTPYAMTPAIDSCTPGPRWHPLMNRQLVELPPPMHLQHVREPEDDVPSASVPVEMTPRATQATNPVVEQARSPLRALDVNVIPKEQVTPQPQKKRRGRPPKVKDCPPPTRKSTRAAGACDNSMALALVSTKGCSKCRWSRNGCGACDPDTPRLPRGPAAAKAKKLATKKTTKTKKSAAKEVDNSMALVVVSTKGCSKCRWARNGCGACDPDTPRLPRGLAARKAKTTTKAAKSSKAKMNTSKKVVDEVDNSMALVLVSKGCSKCRWSRNGCGACDPETPRLPRGPAAAKAKKAKAAPAPKKTTQMKRTSTRSGGAAASSKFINDKTGEVVKELTIVPVRRADGKRGRGRPRVLRPPRTELGCSKCRYAPKGCGKCRAELSEAKVLLKKFKL